MNRYARRRGTLSGCKKGIGSGYLSLDDGDRSPPGDLPAGGPAVAARRCDLAGQGALFPKIGEENFIGEPDTLPLQRPGEDPGRRTGTDHFRTWIRSEEHTSELQ